MLLGYKFRIYSSEKKQEIDKDRFSFVLLTFLFINIINKPEGGGDEKSSILINFLFLLNFLC